MTVLTVLCSWYVQCCMLLKDSVFVLWIHKFKCSLKTIVSLVLATEHLKLYLSDLFYTDTLQLLWVHKARDKKGICRSAINYHYNSLQIFHEDWL